MDLQMASCPKCGGTATLLETRDDFEEIPDLGCPAEKMRFAVKVEELRCQEVSCEHEFERTVKEQTS